MGLVISAVFLIIAFLTFAISAGFLTNATVRITGIREYETNSDLKSAHKWGTIGSIVAWITISLMVIGSILLIIFGSEVIVGFSTYIIYFLLFLSLLGTIIVGVLAALTASDINKSGVSDNNGAYRASIISTVIAIVVFVLLLISIGIKLFYKPKKKEDPTDKEISILTKELTEI